MRAHAKAVRDGLEILLLLVDGMPGAPPPRLVDEWPMRGIHQPDDAVIDRAGQVSGEVSKLVVIAELHHLPRRHRRRSRFRKTCSDRAGIRHIHPDKVVALLTRI